MRSIVSIFRESKAFEHLVYSAKWIDGSALSPWAHEKAFGPRVPFLKDWGLDIRISFGPSLVFVL